MKTGGNGICVGIRWNVKNSTLTPLRHLPKEMRMKMRGMLLLLLLLLPLPAWSKDLPLFFIQRSKNANEVHYQLRVDDRCRIASDTPVSAFWKLLEASPDKTASLSVFDQMAYGVEQQRVANNGVSFHLKALDQKSIKASVTAPPQM